MTVTKHDRVTGRATDLLQALETDSASLLVTDPPWELEGNGRFNDAASYERQHVADIADTLAEARRVLVDGAHAYIFAPAGVVLDEIYREFHRHGWQFQRQLCWDKGDRSGLGAWRNAFEPILILSNGDPLPYTGPRLRWSSVLRFKANRRRTQKPWQIWARAILMSHPGRERERGGRVGA